MTRRRRFLCVIGQLGVLSALIVGGPGGAAWGSITIVKQTEPVTQNAPAATSLPAAPGSLTARAGESGDSRNLARNGKDTNTAKAKILAIFLKMFDGHRGAPP